MGELVNHARRELELIGEDQEIIDWYLKVIEAFAEFGHSGGSASVAIPTLNALLQFENLSPITNNPEEWMHISVDIAGQPDLWQSRRNPALFSEDEGKHYYEVGDKETLFISKDWNKNDG